MSVVKIVPIDNYDFEKVKYYSLKFDGEKESELEKFFKKYENEHSAGLNFIEMWIAEIGENHGAHSRFFRPEDNSSALPPPSETIRHLDVELNEENLSLRLYCKVLSENIVILGNGGVKESQATMQSPSCWKEFQIISNIASQIDNLIVRNKLTLNGKEIVLEKGQNLLYKK